jgi:hypothetical protein
MARWAGSRRFQPGPANRCGLRIDFRMAWRQAELIKRLAALFRLALVLLQQIQNHLLAR